MIHINKLYKSYGNKEIVHIENLHIKKGHIFGLLGPNAAGKTTTIKMLCTLIKPTHSVVTLNDIDLLEGNLEIRKNIAYVAQYFSLYQELSVYDNILFYAGLYGVNDKKRLDYLLQKYQLQAFRDKKAQSLSGGYQRRLALACALVHDPDIIFLDEPTAGVDPLTRKLLWDYFYELSSEGKTLFVTTHYMEEAERCHHIAFLQKGKLIISGSPTEVAASLDSYDIYICHSSHNPEMIAALNALDSVYLINQFGVEVRILLHKESDVEAVESILNHYLEGNVKLLKSNANLEDVFIALTQGENV